MTRKNSTTTITRWQWCSLVLLLSWFVAGLATTGDSATVNVIPNNNNDDLDAKTNPTTEPEDLIDEIEDPLIAVLFDGGVNGLKDTSFDQPQQDDMSRMIDTDDDKGWMMNNRTVSNSSTDQRRHYQVSVGSHQRQTALSCKLTPSQLQAAIKKAGLSSSYATVWIKTCSSRTGMGSLVRRRRSLQSSFYNTTNVTLNGLAGGIDFSHTSIRLTCLLKRRCILDGEAIARIFNGTNVTLLIEGFQFYNASTLKNDALGSGSALSFIGNSRIIIKDCSFYYNNARYGGGAIQINNSQLILKRSHRRIKFLNNRANYGGAIYGINATILTNITSSSASPGTTNFQGNYANQNGGGAVPVTMSTVQWKQYTLEKSDATANIGGTVFGLSATIQTNIRSSSSRSSIVTFQDNFAYQDGGAVYVRDSTVQLNQVTMETNDAINGGAAMFIHTNVTMTNMYVTGNSANLTGGAFVFLDCNFVINNSSFYSNNGNGSIEAVRVNTSDIQVSDSTFRRSRWYVDTSSTLNLTNTCLPRGSTCEVNGSCNNCCKPYSYWISRADYFCGSEPPKKCFGSDGVELRNALKSYSSGNSLVIANLTNVYGNISNWCTSAVTDWSYMFSPLSFNQDISKWDTSNATTMAGAFYKCIGFYQDISKWNTSKVEDMSHMFEQAKPFNQDVSQWDVSKVITMSYMFHSASFNQNISSWNISRVYDMGNMFDGASTFNQNLCSWKDKCQSLNSTNFAFRNTNCPNKVKDPVCGIGPFCYSC